ncbi:MAG: arginine--tRNA ligase [Candidatus Paracaedibacteraceae bacterium]|nr:arginine--tRNA ligase [Candidatus Paracaedibacteraceae bacterium]
MNCYTLIKQKILTVIAELQKTEKLPGDLKLDAITVEPPKSRDHGEMSTNVAMVLAKAVGQSPRTLAELFLKHIQAFQEVRSAEVAGAGFINMRLHYNFWYLQLNAVLHKGESYGECNLGQGQAMNVEYVSVNPTGPMHAGHGRVAIVGDAMAALMEKGGYKITREYYINDGGAQAATLGRSTYLRYLEALGADIGEIPAGLYPGDYLKPVGEALAKNFGDIFKNQTEEEYLPFFQTYAVDAMMDMIRSDLDLIGIQHDVFASENALVADDAVERAIDILEEKGLVYTGVLDIPKGIEVDDWSAEPQLLFKSTQFGDDVDRVLKRTNGEWTYFAKDIAYHYDKLQRGFKYQINVWGADHAGYIKRMLAAVKAISEGSVTLDIKTCQMVNLLQGGEPLKMSKRAGTFITLKDVVDSVGKDVIRFVMLMRRNDAMLDFDFEKVKEQSKDNPVFYVQYAHARVHSVLRQAESQMGVIDESALKNANLSGLNSDDEIALIQLLASWPRCVEGAVVHREPHRIGGYLYELAAAFHGLWNQGKEDATLRFIVEDKDITMARLALLKGVATVISSGLHLFGVKPVEEMR